MKRDWLTLTFGVVLVGTVVGLSLRENMPHPAAEPARAPAPAPVTHGAGAPAAATPAAETAAAPAPPAKPKSAEAAAAGTRTTRPSPPPAAAESPRAEVESGSALQVQSDVPGASVFLDREFVGTTPLTLRGLTPGQKQLNVTATGHEGYAAAIDLTPGNNRVNVEFTRVRLNASVPVVHRHGMGSCQGTLAATTKGLAYDTPNTTDAFTLTFAEIEEFEVDYVKKNLKVRRRAGKTWNFTNNNADALFVFHRDVSEAKERLEGRK